MRTLDELRPEHLFSLAGRVVLLTGAAGGIGGALAQGFAAAGATMVRADREAAVEELSCELRLAGAEAMALRFDITDPDAVERAFAKVTERSGRLDVAVNHAATIVRKPFLDSSLDEWRKVIDTDLTAGFFIAQQAARVKVGQKRAGSST